MTMDAENTRVLYLVICGAGPASHVDRMITLAHADGWDVWCVATPAAVEHFLDLDTLAALTGHPVRTGHQGRGQPALPKADAVVVAPATYNTINKWAAGAADTYVLTQLAELTGVGVPIVVLPFVNTALAANRVFQRSVDELRASGVSVLLGSGGFTPHPPRTGRAAMDAYPWRAALLAAKEREAGRIFREAWITGVTKHYPGTPKPGYVSPWEDTPDWERSAAASVYEQVAAFIKTTDGAAGKLSREQKGRFVALCWVGQIHRHFPDPKPSYVADWADMPDWQRETDADIFEHIEQHLG